MNFIFQPFSIKVKPFKESAAFILCNAYFSSMKTYVFFVILSVFTFISCDKLDDATLKSFDVYCEMVEYGAKPIALSQPMTSDDVDKYTRAFREIADKRNVALMRVDDWPVTSLIPAEATEGKSVIVLYNDHRRVRQFKLLKRDIEMQVNEPELLARRMGRLLGYDVNGINKLLMQNTDYRTYASFGITDQITHLYYEDAPKAISFYETTLGLEKTGDNQFMITPTVHIQINPVSAQYPAGLPKSTAIALITYKLPEWYAHIQAEGVPIKYTYKPRDGGPHDGFVAIDPGGYLLEFEQFKQHPENEFLMGVLGDATCAETKINDLPFCGSITWTYHQDLLAQENYYKEVLGFQLVADQGWTKIFRTSNFGYIGLVDERRGMEDYADKKAVKIEWKVKDESEMVRYALKTGSMMGPEKYEYSIR